MNPLKPELKWMPYSPLRADIFLLPSYEKEQCSLFSDWAEESFDKSRPGNFDENLQIF
jgi:hypothetical protein